MLITRVRRWDHCKEADVCQEISSCPSPPPCGGSGWADAEREKFEVAVWRVRIEV